VDAALDAFDTQQAGKLLAAYVDDVSNWYVRRSRRRFWDADPAALATLHTVLETVTRLMAPLVPFVTERVWQDLVRPVTRARPSRCTWPPGRRRSTSARAAAPTRASASRSRWCAGWSSLAGRRGPSPG